MKILLIRHGESEGNAGRLIQGLIDYPLTPLGRRQATAVGRYLSMVDMVPRQIFASPLKRARQTAELIHDHLTVRRPPPLSFHKGLEEVDVGKLAGLTFKELKARHPQYYQRPAHRQLDYSLWGGHSQEDFYEGVYRELDEITKGWNVREDRTVALVTHGAVVRAALAYFLNRTDDHQLHYKIGNCSVMAVTIYPAGPGLRRSVEAFLPVEHMLRVVEGVQTGTTEDSEVPREVDDLVPTGSPASATPQEGKVREPQTTAAVKSNSR
ncbi:MAG TPA: histidine phosphatase family protein [bacterium]|nr:histidine phosphatase family protein [bacterium]